MTFLSEDFTKVVQSEQSADIDKQDKEQDVPETVEALYPHLVPPWEGMVSFETFQKIQERLAGRAYAPARKDLNTEFPLRGAVACTCGNSLTACMSKSNTGKHHPYYLCQNRKCEYKGKSIRRDVLEGEFEALLKKLMPARSLLVTADKMFKTLWEHRMRSQRVRRTQFENEWLRSTQPLMAC